MMNRTVVFLFTLVCKLSFPFASCMYVHACAHVNPGWEMTGNLDCTRYTVSVYVVQVIYHRLSRYIVY